MRFLDTSRIRVRLDQRIAASDGTQLSIDLYLPPDAGRYPVLLIRTAADNNRLQSGNRIGADPAQHGRSLESNRRSMLHRLRSS